MFVKLSASINEVSEDNFGHLSNLNLLAVKNTLYSGIGGPELYFVFNELKLFAICNFRDTMSMLRLKATLERCIRLS